MSHDTNTTRPQKVKGSIDHLAISESLGYQIFRKTKKNTWTPEEDERLRSTLYAQYASLNGLSQYSNERIDAETIDWNAIAAKMSSRRAKECKKRWTSSLDPHLRKGKWTQAEDELLVKAYKKHGPMWQKVALLIEGRNEDQCSKRYTEVLLSDSKERLKSWSLEEDMLLIEGVRTYGTKWRTIATSLPNRPSLTCRNRWRKIMTEVARGRASEEIKKAVGVLDDKGQPLIMLPHQKTAEVKGEEQSKQTESSKRALTPLESDSKRQKMDAGISTSTSNSPKVFSPPISTVRYGTPTQNNTEWKYSLVDPTSNEDIPAFSGPITSNEVAQKLVDMAKFNGVNITVHQHIHHHYSSTGTQVPDPQTTAHRYSHFNYLPPLTEVPKLTSSSSPDNSESNASNSSHKGDPSLLKLLNTNNEPKKDFPRARQQLQPSSTMSPSGLSNMITSKSPTPTMEKPRSGNYLTEDLEEELDFWEAMRSITQPKAATTKPVSQHHPLHYTQPSTYKAQAPYSDSYGVSRFPNMASPSVPGTPSEFRRTAPAQTEATPGAQRGDAQSFGGIYANGDAEEDDEEEDVDIANQYGVYYSVLQGNNTSANNTPAPQANSLATSGYLMPFNPS